jgi:two-component system sensor histidine kinase PilS (NtrC family)
MATPTSATVLMAAPALWASRPRWTALMWLAGLRALVAVALLAPLAAFTAGQGRLSLAAWLGLLPVVPLASSGVGLLLGERISARGLAAQLCVDAVIVLAVVWSTGGLLSPYSPLLLLPVLAVSVLGGRPGGLRAAAGMGAGVVLLAGVQYGWLPAPDTTSLADLTTLSQRVIDSMAGGLIVTDAQGVVVLFNRTAETIIGRRADDVLGQPMDRVLPLPTAVAGSGLPVRQECSFTRIDGSVIELGATVAPLMAGGGVRAGQLVTFQDLTLINQRDAERQRQERLAAVGEMAAGIAHEIRNPLASMSGSIQLLRRELNLRDDQATLLDIVLRESQRLNDIIRNFLSYAGPQRVSRARVDVARLVREVAALLEQQARAATPSIRVHVDADQPVHHDVDEAQVRQVLWNLASNAFKAMPDGGVLHLRAEAVLEPSGASVRVSVRDDGVGMAAADVERMFQPFQSGFRQGSGLGLAIVRRIVTDHGGRVSVQSTPGAGTEVVVVLPAQPARTQAESILRSA